MSWMYFLVQYKGIFNLVTNGSDDLNADIIFYTNFIIRKQYSNVWKKYMDTPIET